MCTIGQCVCTSTVTSMEHDVSVSNTTSEATDQEFTPNGNLMYPFSLRAMHHVVQSVPHFSVRMKPTSCEKNVFSISTPLLGADVSIVFAATKCPPTVAACSCATKQVLHTSITRDLTSRHVHRIRLAPRATPNQRLRGVLFLAPPGHTSFSDLCPLTTRLDSPGSRSSFSISRCSRRLPKLVFLRSVVAAAVRLSPASDAAF